MTIHEELKDAFAREKPLSVAKCNALLPRLDVEVAAASDRMKPVHPGSMSFNRGDEYKAALLSGSAEQVTEIRNRYERLQSEHDILQNYRSELLRQRTAARTREAFENLPDLQQGLVSKLDAAEAARRALEDAMGEVDAACTAITQARGDCSMGGLHSDAAASRETVNRLMTMKAYVGRRADEANIKNALGSTTLSSLSH